MVIRRREARRTAWIRRHRRGGDRPLDQRQVVWAANLGAGGLGKRGDLDLADEFEQLVLAVQQLELTAVQEANFHTASFGPFGPRARHHSSLVASSGVTRW